MAGWEEELALLLQELGVKQEEPDARSRQSSKPSRKSARKPRASDTSQEDDFTRYNQFSDSLRHPGNATGSVQYADGDLWANDLGLMRREVDSIVRQVVRLMQHGDIEPSIKEDVMVVLRALRRRAMVTQQAAATDEAYLESAAAMLHFCRLVLQISGNEDEL